MLGYVEKAMREFQHPEPSKLEHQLHCHNKPQYGVKIQMADPLDITAPLSNENNKLLQNITDKFLVCVSSGSNHAGHTKCAHVNADKVDRMDHE
jgi:hypothetical protein